MAKYELSSIYISIFLSFLLSIYLYISTYTPEVGGKYSREETAQVDRGVEHGKVGGEGLGLLGQLELVGSQGNHAGLDAASSNCYQEDANERNLKV